jgi:hypothetical protein
MKTKKMNRHRALVLCSLLCCSLRPHAQTAWHLLHPLPTPYGLAGVNYGNGQFVAVGYFGAVITSPDAVSWTSQFAQNDGDLEDVAYGNGRFVAIGVQEDLGADQPPYPYSPPTSPVLTSTDGISWKVGASPDGFRLWRLAFANDLFVAFGENSDELLPAILTSPDGIVWTERWRGNRTDAWGALGGGPDIAVGNGAIVATLVGGLSQGFLVTTNNLNWVEVTTDVIAPFLSFGCGKFVAVGVESNTRDLKAILSSDGFTWESLTVRTNWNGDVQALGYGNGTFVILGSPVALISNDGRAWTEHSPNASGLGNGKLFYAQNTFVMVGQPQRGQYFFNAFATIVTSPDGINWTQRFGDTDSFLVGAAASDQGVVAIANSSVDYFVGDTSVFLASTNGAEWRQTQRLAAQNLSSIVYGNGFLVAAGDTGIVISPDGTNWITQTNAGTGWWRVRYGMGGFLALGQSKLGTSSNGLVWTVHPLETVSSPRDAATDGQYLVLTDSQGSGQPSVIWRSSDGSHWTQVYRDANAYPRLVAFGNGRYVAVETYPSPNADAVLISTDGTNWTKQASFTAEGITDLIFANGSFYATASTTSQVLSSSDGVQWKPHPTGFHQGLSGLAAGRQGLFAIGSAGIMQSPWDLVLSTPEVGFNDSLLIRLAGPPGTNVILQRASTLNDWADWQTVTLGDSPMQVEDTNVLTSSRRFYRAVLPP